MRNSFATRLEDPSFMTAFNALFGRFMSKQVVTLMRDSFATRLEDPSMTAFNASFGRFTSKQVVTLMRESFATGLEDPSFMPAFNALLDRLRPSKWSRS